jgi:peroxiredoxin
MFSSLNGWFLRILVVMDAALLSCNDTAISKKEKVWQRERIKVSRYNSHVSKNFVIDTDSHVSLSTLDFSVFVI